MNSGKSAKGKAASASQGGNAKKKKTTKVTTNYSKIKNTNANLKVQSSTKKKQEKNKQEEKTTKPSKKSPASASSKASRAVKPSVTKKQKTGTSSVKPSKAKTSPFRRPCSPMHPTIMPFGSTSSSDNEVEAPASTKAKAVSSTSKAVTTSEPVRSSARTRPELSLPQTRIKTIMKTSPEVEFIGSDALILITKSTELFIDHMASQAFTRYSDRFLEYKHLAELTQSDDNMDFLKDLIPRKTQARVALQEIEKHREVLRQELLQ